MKRTPTCLGLFLLAASLTSPAVAQTLRDLIADGNGGSTDNVLTYGMGYHQHRYSPLRQIDKQTVKRLVPVWNASLGSNYGEQGQPPGHPARGVLRRLQQGPRPLSPTKPTTSTPTGR